MTGTGQDRRGPDFVGVGTQRSGTTWWFDSLLEHPDVVAPESGKKELHYFQRFCLREMTDADVAHYRTRFAPGPGQVAGEWTPRYAHDFWTPPLLRRAAPDAKLLLLLRDPIERLRSGLPHRLDMAGIPRAQRAVTDAIERGRYATQLRRLLAWWEPDRLLVLQYERCVADPAGEYARTLRFLGVDDGFVPDDLRRPRGVSYDGHKPPLWDDLLAGLRAALDQEVADLAALVPDIDLSLWPNFRAEPGHG